MLYAIGKNTVGYSPDPEQTTVIHVDTSTADALAGSALDIARILADDIVRDGESSIDGIMASPEDYETEAEWLEDSAGDSGMVGLFASESSEGFRDMLWSVTRALQSATDYSYFIAWNTDALHTVYWTMPVTDSGERCTEDYCDICGEDSENV